MTPSPQSERICIVGCCCDDDCPKHGEYIEKGWDTSGLHPRYFYCYEADKRLPESSFEFPDWCPLSTIQSERNIMLDEVYQKFKDDLPIFEGQWEDIENIFKELRSKQAGEQHQNKDGKISAKERDELLEWFP
jgi:hypothetical protein